MKAVLIFLGVLLFSLILTSCSPGIDLDEPPDIFYGEDTCEECNMIISEPRFAAAYTTAEGERRRFDDIGGMGTYHTKHHEDVARFWVHDYMTEEWLLAEEATYVMSLDLYTPMAFGVVAFQDRAQAEALAGETSGIVMSFAEVLAYYENGDETSEHQHNENE